MTNPQTQSFHPRLIINDHFDRVINQIDVSTESVLQDQSLTENDRNQLNKKRDIQIEKIKEIEQINFRQSPFQLDHDEYMKRWSSVLNDIFLDYNHKIERIKEELIGFDCVLLEKSNLIKGLQLCITPCFFDEKSREFLK